MVSKNLKSFFKVFKTNNLIKSLGSCPEKYYEIEVCKFWSWLFK